MYSDPDCANKDNDLRVKNIEQICDASFLGELAGDTLGAGQFHSRSEQRRKT